MEKTSNDPTKDLRTAKRIFGLCKRLGLDDDTRRGAVAVVTTGRTDSVSQLTFEEANALITHLGGDPSTRKRSPQNPRAITPAGGRKQIAQPGPPSADARSGIRPRDHRRGLKRMGERMLKHWPPHTTAETNKMVEALKSMNRRDAERRAA